MIEECRGCCLIRILEDEAFTEDQMHCEYENLPCPCKTCIVKITCDIVNEWTDCSYYTDFSMKYATNEYWINRRKEKNASISL